MIAFLYEVQGVLKICVGGRGVDQFCAIDPQEVDQKWEHLVPFLSKIFNPNVR